MILIMMPTKPPISCYFWANNQANEASTADDPYKTDKKSGITDVSRFFVRQSIVLFLTMIGL